MELLLIIGASYASWHTLLPLLPFRFPERLAPLAVVGIAMGWWFLPVRLHWALVSAAACTGVLLVRRALVLTGLRQDPWSWPDVRVWLPRKPVLTTSQHHVPGEAPSRVGKRIPKL